MAAAFIYTETDFSQLDINLQGKEYRVTRIDAVNQYTGDGNGRGGGYTKIITVAPGWDEYPNFNFYGTNPAKELHEAFISAFPAAPGTLTVHTKTDTLTKEDGTPEVITYVALTSSTSTEGAYYMAELLSQLSEENG